MIAPTTPKDTLNYRNNIPVLWIHLKKHLAFFQKLNYVFLSESVSFQTFIPEQVKNAKLYFKSTGSRSKILNFARLRDLFTNVTDISDVMPFFRNKDEDPFFRSAYASFHFQTTLTAGDSMKYFRQFKNSPGLACSLISSLFCHEGRLEFLFF